MNHKPLAVLISFFLVPVIFLVIVLGWYNYTILNYKNYERVLANQKLYDTLIGNIEKNFLEDQDGSEAEDSQIIITAIKNTITSESVKAQINDVLPKIFAYLKGQADASPIIDLTSFKNSFYQSLFDSMPVCKSSNSENCRSADISYESFINEFDDLNNDQILIPDQIDLSSSLPINSPVIKINSYAQKAFWVGLFLVLVFIIGLLTWSKKQIGIGLKYIGIPALIASIPLVIGSILVKVGIGRISSLFTDVSNDSQFIAEAVMPLIKEITGQLINSLLITSLIILVISVALIIIGSLGFWKKYSSNTNL